MVASLLDHVPHLGPGASPVGPRGRGLYVVFCQSIDYSIDLRIILCNSRYQEATSHKAAVRQEMRAESSHEAKGSFASWVVAGPGASPVGPRGRGRCGPRRLRSVTRARRGPPPPRPRGPRLLGVGGAAAAAGLVPLKAPMCTI